MTDVGILSGNKLKVGDTGPPLRVQLIDENGDPQSLRGASADIFIRKAGADTLTVDASASIFDETNGIVEYDWQSGDTDDAGSYEAEVEITDSNGDVITFPNDYYFRVRVMEDL